MIFPERSDAPEAHPGAAPCDVTALFEVVARDRIRQLAYRYADAVDRRDIDLLVSLFAPDASFGSWGTGPSACRRLSEASLARIGVAVLLVANHLIDFDDPDNAKGTVWCHGHIDDHQEGWIEQLIKYEDRYVRRDGVWLFARRRHLLWYGMATLASPLGQEPADWPKRQVGRGSIPYDDPSWQQFWVDRKGAS